MHQKSHRFLDLTTGSIPSKIIRFALPLMATSILQLLYNAADIAVIGQFAGEQAMAAVGASTPPVWLVVDTIIGLSLGTGVAVAHAKGAQDHEKISRIMHTAVLLALLLGVIISPLIIFATPALLRWMSVPHDVIDLSALYLTIYFIGLPINLLYNFSASILRALGDTKRPLKYLLFSGLVNVLLNLLLVVVFHAGVAGVAIATVTSQALSAFLVVRTLRWGEGALKLRFKKLKIDRECLKRIFQIGLPTGFQSLLSNTSNALIQVAVNGYGSLVIAGVTAAGNLESFCWAVLSAVAQATLTFSSTNLGAKNFQRVRKALWFSLGIIIPLIMTLGLSFVHFGSSILSLYNSNPAVIQAGLTRLTITLSTYFMAGAIESVAAQMRALGYSFLTSIVGTLGICVFRLIWIFTLFADATEITTLYWVYPISWGITFLAQMICYLTLGRKKLRKLEIPS